MMNRSLSFSVTAAVLSFMLAQPSFARPPKAPDVHKPGETGSGVHPDGTPRTHIPVRPGGAAPVLAPTHGKTVTGEGEGIPTTRRRFTVPSDATAAAKENMAKETALKGLNLGTDIEADLRKHPSFANATPDDVKALAVLIEQKKKGGGSIDSKELIEELETVQGLKSENGPAEQVALTEKLKGIREKIDADKAVEAAATKVIQAKDVASFEAALKAEGVDTDTIKILSAEFEAAKGDAVALSKLREKLEVAIYIKKHPEDEQTAQICSLKGGACPCQ